MTILSDVLDHYMTIDQVHAMVDAYYDYTLQDRTDEMTIRAEWNAWPGSFVFTEARRDAIKTFYTNRWNWLKNTWLPSQGYTAPSNAHPTIEITEVSRLSEGIEIEWQYNDAEADACTVDLYWLDKKWSQMEPIPDANNLPAEGGSFVWTNDLPDDEFLNRGIYIHAVIHDDVSDLPGHDTSDSPLIVLKSCNQVWNYGYGMVEDLNRDCRVNLVDVAMVTSEWLQSNFNTTLIAEDASKRVLQPTAEYPVDDSWKGGQSFDDSSWNDYSYISDKLGAVGYELSSGFQDYISYDIGGVNGNLTRYIRIHFSVNESDLSLFTELTLRMRYDDAFVAYINGEEVTRSDYVPTSLTWDSGAVNSHDDSLAIQFENFDISDHISILHAGDNVLALHALNYLTSSSDFLMSIELVAGNNNPLAADINEDNVVDLDDMVRLAMQWLECNNPEDPDCTEVP